MIYTIKKMKRDRNGVSKGYYQTGNLKREVVYKDDIAVSGYNYEEDGRKREMTNAHLHKINQGL